MKELTVTQVLTMRENRRRNRRLVVTHIIDGQEFNNAFESVEYARNQINWALGEPLAQLNPIIKYFEYA